MKCIWDGLKSKTEYKRAKRELTNENLCVFLLLCGYGVQMLCFSKNLYVNRRMFERGYNIQGKIGFREKSFGNLEYNKHSKFYVYKGIKNEKLF